MPVISAPGRYTQKDLWGFVAFSKVFSLNSQDLDLVRDLILKNKVESD